MADVPVGTPHPEPSPTEIRAEQVWLWDTVRIFVLRVAKDGTWADIECTGLFGDPWRKRQHLVGGRFPFDAAIKRS